MRIAVDPALLPFLDDLDEGLDVQHFLERAAGVQGLASEVGGIISCFTGRDAEFRKLSPWINDVPDEIFSGPLAVVTGSPGAGKSALLGVLVCATHPLLRAPTRPLWGRIVQAPYPIDHAFAAVHSRGRSLRSVTASIARQLRIPDGDTLEAILDYLQVSDSLPIPVIVVDAIDEAEDGLALFDGLLRPLAGARRASGMPAVKILVGTRGYPEFEPVIGLARASGTLINLDDIAPEVLESDLDRYIQILLGSTTTYGGRRFGAFRGAFASSLAAVLTRRNQPAASEYMPGLGIGPFLAAGLYTRHIMQVTADRPTNDSAVAGQLGEQAPATLVELLEMDVKAQPDEHWLLPVILTLAGAHGQGMPVSVIRRVVSVFAPDGASPTVSEVRGALRTAKVYVRQSIDTGGTTAYRLFHQSLVDSLQPRTAQHQAAIFAALLRQLGSPPTRDWQAAEPYILHHILAHAEAAGDRTAAAQIEADPEFAQNQHRQ